MQKRTLRKLTTRAYTVCLSDYLLQEKLHHIETCFTENNGYPKCLLKQKFDPFKTSNKSFTNKINNKSNNDTSINTLSNKIVYN